MNKKLLTIVLTVLLFFSAVALGVSTVFRVDTVAVEATTVTEEAKAQTTEIQEKLTALYKRGSIFSVKEGKAHDLMEAYPKFRITEIEKSYPNKLVVKISEDAAVYTVETEDTAYLLNEDGIILDILSLDKAQGNATTHVKGLNATGEKGEKIKGDEGLTSMLSLCKGMHGALEGIARNIVSVEVLISTPKTIYRAITKEGVRIYVDDPATLSEEKGAVAVKKYLSLSDGERMTGRILVVDAENQVSAGYAATDEFVGL